MQFSGKSDAVCSAIADQYLPISAEGALPRNRIGAALAVLDKADLIVSCFVIGKIPTSSQDPYALKRSLNGLLRIVVEDRLSLSWTKLVTEILGDIQKSRLVKRLDFDGVRSQLAVFFNERLVIFFTKAKGFREELVQAVLATDSDSVYLIHERLEALSQLEGAESFKRTLKVMQRTSNILKSGKDGVVPGEIKPHIFTDDLERQLYEVYEKQKSPILKAAGEKQYALATSLYADAFFDILHLFFEKVLVNVPEPDVRQNRLSLLAAVRSLYKDSIADLSKVKATTDGS